MRPTSARQGCDEVDWCAVLLSTITIGDTLIRACPKTPIAEACGINGNRGTL